MIRFSRTTKVCVGFLAGCYLFYEQLGLAVTEKPTPPQGPAGAKKRIETNATYQSLLKPIDIYSPPAKAKKLLPLQELYTLIQTKGVALKVSRETYNAAKQSQTTENDRKRPVLTFDLAQEQKWSKTLSDSDPTDEYADRKRLTGSRVVNGNGGFSLAGSPLQGVSYKLSFPQLVHSQTIPDSSSQLPARPDQAAVSATLGVSLLKDSPILAESLQRKKIDLAIAAAREQLRSETIKTIFDAESNYFALIQKYLQLAVQDRSLQLARALKAEVQEKIKAGESSALEATRAELQEAQAEVDYMSSQIEYEASLESFRTSLSYDDTEGDGVFPDPSALKVDVEKFSVPRNLISDIRNFNPEIARAKIQRKQAEVDMEVARNATLPSLAFSLNYSNATAADGLIKSSAESLSPNDRLFSINLSYSHVLYNNTAKNDLRQSLVSQQKAIVDAASVEQRIIKDHNSLLKKIEIGGRRYRIAKVSKDIAERKITSEYERFRAGESSVRNVIDAQTEVNSARISEIGARIEMLNAINQLRSLLGKLPDGLELVF